MYTYNVPNFCHKTVIRFLKIKEANYNNMKCIMFDKKYLLEVLSFVKM